MVLGSCGVLGWLSVSIGVPENDKDLAERSNCIWLRGQLMPTMNKALKERSALTVNY